MTRKDFELIAGALRESRPSEGVRRQRTSGDAREVATWLDCCARMASALATTNASFQRDRFLRACGLES